MKNRMIPKFILDIVLTVLFLILIDPKNTGFTIHEIAGLSMGTLFGFHFILNWPWVKNIAKNLGNPKLKSRPKWHFVLDAVSFLSVLTILVTGIGISHVLFAGAGWGVSHNWVVVHKWVSYFCLGLFSVHITLHWRFLFEAVKKLLATLQVPHLGKTARNLGATVLIGGLLYSQVVSSATFDTDKVKTQIDSTPAQSRSVYNNKSQSGTSTAATLGTGSSSSSTQTEPSQTSTLSATNAVDTGDSTTLHDYLSNMFCNGCEKHCSLLNLGCDKGTRQLQAAQIQYQQLSPAN